MCPDEDLIRPVNCAIIQKEFMRIKFIKEERLGELLAKQRQEVAERQANCCLRSEVEWSAFRGENVRIVSRRD